MFCLLLLHRHNSYVVEGELTHQDSMGTKETLGRGAIQFMTAGKGVTHSEHNLHPTNPLRFIQMWINCRERGVEPLYGSMHGDYDRQNRWYVPVHVWTVFTCVYMYLHMQYMQ